MTGNSSLQVTYSTFTNNTGSQGGAIGVGQGGQLEVLESSFHTNRAQNGGGIYALQCAPFGLLLAAGTAVSLHWVSCADPRPLAWCESQPACCSPAVAARRQWGRE